MVDVRCVESEVPELLVALDTSKEGLSSEEASKRLSIYGRNIIVKHEKPSLLSTFLEQFSSPLVGLLLLAATLSAFIGEINEAVVILAVVLLNAIIGTYHERQALSSMESLKRLTRENTKTYRDGTLTIVPSEQLVPGDVILLTEGDKVPADARIIEAKSFKVDESALTGEPVSVPKTDAPSKGKEVHEMENIAFAGTLVVSGEALAVVCSTGRNTVLGKVYGRLSVKERFPAHEKLKAFSRTLMKATVLGFLGVLVLGYLSNLDPLEIFNIAVAQAVSFIPEGLPIAVTVALAVSAYDMAKKKAVVRKLEAMEGIGQVDFLCVDKTGTLTKNHLVLEAIAIDGETYILKDGQIFLDGKKLDPTSHSHLLEVLEYAALSAVVKGKELNFGDPLDVALIRSIFSLPLTVNPKSLFSLYKLVDESPFDFNTKTTCKKYLKDGEELTLVKGSPESILSTTTHTFEKGKVVKLTKQRLAFLREHLENLTSKGYRVVGLSLKKGAKSVFVAFLCFWDEIRDDARASIEKLKAAGIKVLMITGDHKLTARAVSKRVGLGSRVLTQEELFSLPKEEMYDALEKTGAIARASIEGKLKIIEVLKSKGKLVAMTGDGVNDAAALREAHVGISLGSGTDVAKEASDILVLDDSISSIAEAVEEGRRSIVNIIKTVRYLLTTNITEVAFLFSSLLASALSLGLSYPLKAMHILYVNLVTDGLCDVAIATEPKEKELSRRRPRFFQRGYSNPDMVAFIAVGAAVSLIVLLIVSSYFEGSEKRTSAVLTALVFLQLWIALSSRKFTLSLDGQNHFLLGAIVAAMLIHLLALYYAPLSNFMGLVPLKFPELLAMFILSSLVFICLETFKVILPLLRLAYK